MYKPTGEFISDLSVPVIKEAPKRRIHWFRELDIKTAAAFLMRISDMFCNSDCGEDYVCPHEMTCALKWLEEETYEAPWPETENEDS